MRISHVVSVCFTALTSLALFGGGCGSSDGGSGFGIGDDGGSSGSSGNSSGFVTGDSGAKGPCTGLACQVNPSCSTSLTGFVYAPNGKLPLYNAIVYVPNSKPDAITHGATCDQCGAVTGDPITTTISNADGSFTLTGMPAGDNIPLIIQVGKWRRQTTIAKINDCTDNSVTDPELTRLPKNQSEGDIPRIALTTGGCDILGCMLPKIGLDKSEFAAGNDLSKSVNVYNGDWPNGGGGPGPANSATGLWNSAATLKAYDLAVLSCECTEATQGNAPAGNATKNATSYQAMTDYLTAGGRIFTTDFMYTWYKYSPDAGLKAAATLPGGAPVGGSPLTIDTSFPKGKALGDWLNTVIPGSNDKVAPDVVFANTSSVDNSKAQTWASSPAGGFGGGGAGPRVFTVNVPVGVPEAMQCGRGVHLDAHLNVSTSQGGSSSDVIDKNYPNGCGSELTDGEKLLAFFFFDLASCIQKDTDTPTPPVVK